jgi:hypothetical protein
MIEELANLLDDFPGPANQTRCFTHVLNLVVKSIIRQFDSPNSKNKHEATNEMLSNIEFDGDGDCEDDNVEGWVDERELMTEEELEELDESVEPLRLLLMKVS